MHRIWVDIIKLIPGDKKMKSSLNRTSRLMLTSIAAACVYSAGVQAQTLEEITVTARKIEESIQDVPVAITAFSKKSIKELSIEELEDVALLTPGLTFEDYSNGGFGTPTVRGASQINISQLEQNVSTFLNGVYIPRQYAVDIGTLNLERIEVVKGPQSALYGANAFLGAINYVSATPTLDGTTGSVTATLGSDERFDVSAEVNTALIPNVLGLRVAGGYSEFDGDFTNNNPSDVSVSGGVDGNIGGFEKDAFELGIKYQPSERFSLEFDFHRFNNETEGRGATRLNTANNDLNCSGIVSAFTGISSNRLFCGELPDEPVPGPSGVAGIVAEPRSFGIDAETEVLSFGLSYDLNEAWAVNYKFGNIQGDVFSGGSSDRDPITGTSFFGSPFLNVFTLTPIGGFDYDSHELRFDFQGNNGTVATIGLFTSDGDDEDIFVAGFLPLGGSEPLTSFSQLTGAFGPGPAIPTTTITNTRTDAIFGRIQFGLSEALTLSLEGRYTDEEKDVSDLSQAFTYEEDYFTPKASLDYKLSDNTLLYASIGQGVKSGGVNVSNANLIDEERFFDVDENVSFEIGYKGTLANGAWQLNGAAYFIDWSDLQVNATATNAGPFDNAIVLNLGSAESQGFEIDTSYIVSDSLTLNAGFAYVDATYDEGTISGRIERANACDGIVCSPDGDVGGNTLPRSSDVQWNIGATYSGSLGNESSFFARIDVVGQSDQYVSEINAATIPSRTLVNLRGGVDFGNWTAELWVKNATDELYVSNAFFTPFSFAVDYIPTFGNLRQWGVTATYKF